MNRRPRPRIMLKVGVFLLLGAIVNVAVAWGCAIGSVEHTLAEDSGVTSLDGLAWSLQVCKHPGVDVVERKVFKAERRPTVGIIEPGMVVGYIASSAPMRRRAPNYPRTCAPYWSDANARPPFMPDDNDPLGEFAAGYPFRAVKANYRVQVPGYREMVSYGVEISGFRTDGMRLRILPTYPIWLGFAINTIFYAAMLWLLWSAPGTIRRYRTRRRRMREHRCLACNYQIAEGVGPNCSECGASLPKSLLTSELARFQPREPA